MAGNNKTNRKPPRQRPVQYDNRPRKAPGTSTSTAFKGQPTEETITRATYQSTSSKFPFAHRAKAPEKQEDVAKELDGFWTRDPPVDSTPELGLLGDFFPDTGADLGASSMSEKWSKSTGWKNWPDASLSAITERQIATAFVTLLNSIIEDLGMGENRVAIDRQDFGIRTRDGSLLKPDVFLWGRGSSAFPYMEDKPPSTTEVKKKRGRGEADDADYEPDYARPEKNPAVEWPWCVIPIELKTQVNRGGPGAYNAFIQLGTYAREVLAAQPNRRFVPSLVLTERTVEFLLWDLAGVVVSERIDYHVQADLFYRMLVRCVSWNDFDLGFDPTAFYHHNDPKNPNLHIRIPREVAPRSAGGEQIEETEEVGYAVEQTLSRPYALRGRGSTCWRARKLGDEHTYLVLDSWIEGGASTKRDLLDKIEATRPATDGCRLIHFDDVSFPTDATEPHRDTINCNRIRERCHVEVDLVHTRAVWQCHDTPVPLDQWASPQEFISALLNVIQDHERMYRRARIVHRDVVPWNIFILRGTTGNSRGILIDFSCATSIDPEHPIVPRPDTTPGASYFMSHNALVPGKTADSYLDELECFYWMVCSMFSTRKHPDPKRRHDLELTSEMHALVHQDTGKRVGFSKRIHFYAPFSFPVPASVRNLASELHDFFGRHVAQEDARLRRLRVLQFNPQHDKSEHEQENPKQVEKDYQEITGYFSQALHTLAPLAATSS